MSKTGRRYSAIISRWKVENAKSGLNRIVIAHLGGTLITRVLWLYYLWRKKKNNPVSRRARISFSQSFICSSLDSVYNNNIHRDFAYNTIIIIIIIIILMLAVFAAVNDRRITTYRKKKVHIVHRTRHIRAIQLIVSNALVRSKTPSKARHAKRDRPPPHLYSVTCTSLKDVSTKYPIYNIKRAGLRRTRSRHIIGTSQ